MLCLAAMLVSTSSFGQGTPSNVLPDLEFFKLTFPLDEDGDDYQGVNWDDRDDPLIKAWERDDLDGWSPPSPYSEYFFVSGGDVVFRAHCAGALTSANSYPRCELRETPNGTDDLWEFDDEHELNATFRVTNLPNEKEEVCMLQIKGNDSNNTSGTEEAFRLEYRADGNQGVHVTINENTTLPDIMDYSVGQTMEARMYINNGEITIELNNTSISGSNGEWNYTYDSDYSHGYFKAGAYTQSSIWEEKNGVADENANAFSEVRFSKLILGPDDGGGGSTCTPQVPGNKSVNNVDDDSATLSWNSVDDVQDYDLRYKPTSSSSWQYETNLTSTSINISGLSDDTQYQWQVKSVCSNGDDTNYSQGPGPNFTTDDAGGGGGGGGDLPSPWETQDIGNVGATGDASYSGNTFTIEGSGADIWNNADEFRFVYQTLNGDGEITAQVNSLENTNTWAKAGVMIRESLAAGSKHATTIVRPSQGASFQRRTSTNGSSAHTSLGGPAPPEYVRIVRNGNSFTSYYSGNGSSWTQIGNAVTVSMSSSVYIGLVVTSHNDGTLATSTMSNVSVSSGGGGGGGCTASVPSNRQVGNVTESSAVVTWNTNGADNYDVRYKKVVDSDWNYNNNNSGGSTTITNIVEETTYEWQVRSQCDGGSSSSWNSGQGPDFTTDDNGGGGGGGGNGCDLPWSDSDFTANDETVNYSSGSIDISCVSDVCISVDLEGIGPMENADYLNVYYKVNGGSQQTLSTNVNSFSQKTEEICGISGNSVEIIIVAFTSYNNETYYISNIEVTEDNGGGGGGGDINLAFNKPTSQSSTGFGGVSSRAVDGNTNGNWNAGSITHTSTPNNNQWWEVDLGSTYSIGDINVWNRTNCCSSRLGNFTVSVINSSGNTTWSQTVTSAPNPSTTINAGGASGEVIRIDQNLNQHLSLAEVQVYSSNNSQSGENSSSRDKTDEVTELHVYPNPATNTLFIDGVADGQLLQIVDLSGRLIKTSVERKIDISDLESGIYFIHTNRNNIKRFIKL